LCRETHQLLIQNGAAPAWLRRRPQEGVAPTPNPCQLPARASHCHSTPFQRLSRRKGRKKVAGRDAASDDDRPTKCMVHPPLPLSLDERAMFFICTRLLMIPQEDAAEHLGRRTVRPITPSAPSALRAPPLPRQSPAPASSGRTALIATRGDTDLPDNEQGVYSTAESQRSGSLTRRTKSTPCLLDVRRGGRPSGAKGKGKSSAQATECARSRLDSGLTEATNMIRTLKR
jgi:hypothetical protein